MRPSAERPLLPANRELVRGLAVVAAFLVVCYVVITVRQALLQIFMAVFLAAVLEPLVRLMESRLKIRRAFAAVLVVAGVVAAGIGVVALLVIPFYGKMHDVLAALPGIAQQIRSNDRLGQLDHGGETTDALKEASQWFATHLPTVADTLLGIVGAAVGAGFAAFTILFMTLFLLLEGARLERWSRGYVDPDLQDRIERVAGDVTRLTGSYVAGALGIALIASVVMYAAMRVVGVPYAAGLAVVVFVLDLVPMIGATIAAVLIMLVALTVSTEASIIMGVVALVYQQIENNVTQPLVQRKTVSLSPFLIVASVLLGSALLGVLGALLAIPAAAATKVIAQEFLTLPGENDAAEPAPDP